ncbi:hypothetical protein Tco_1549901 [Tanacetum coccineum]
MAPPAHSSPPPALVDAVNAALPSPPLPPLPPYLYIPPPVDRRDDIPETERPPHKRSCLFALGSRYEVGESSTARPTGEAVPEIAYVTLGEVSARVVELVELYEHDIHDLYALLEDAQDGRTRISQQMQQAEMAELRETDHRRQAQMIETLRVMRDMRREMGDMQAELLALREQRIRARQPAPDARVPDHKDAFRDADSHIYWTMSFYFDRLLSRHVKY